MDQEWVGWGVMTQALYIYCVLSFYYNHISTTSNHQPSDPRAWGPLH